MTSRKLPLVAFPLLLSAVVGIGCGGDGSEEVSAAELVQRGDQICRTEQTQFSRIQAQPPSNASAAADQTKELVGVAEAVQSDLRDLEPPENLQAAYDRYLAARDRALDQIKKGKAAADDRDSRGYGAAQAAAAKSAPERRKLARAVGFAVCSRSAGPGAP